MRLFGVWFLYSIVCSTIWYLLSEQASVSHSLLIGASIGLIGAGTYAIRHRSGNDKQK